MWLSGGRGAKQSSTSSCGLRLAIALIFEYVLDYYMRSGVHLERLCLLSGRN